MQTLLGVLLILTGPAFAETFCVQSSQDLSAALIAAGNNGEADDIKIAQGFYSVPTGGFLLTHAEDFDVSISGNWIELIDIPCGIQLSENAFNTVLDGGGTEQILRITLNNFGDIRISALFFTNAFITDDVIAARGGGLRIFSSPNYAGHVLIENNAFVNNTADFGAALSVGIGDLITIRNNLFTQNKSFQCCSLELLSEDAEGIYVINNTVYQNTHQGSGSGATEGLWIAVLGTSQALVANNILWGNDFADLELIGDGVTSLKNNNIGDVVGTASLSAKNFSVDPDFEPGVLNFTPAEGSLMINAGIEPLSFPIPVFGENWSVGAADLEGDTRVQKGRVDIGAVESAWLDIIFMDGAEPQQN
ncbi:hypothetical protein ACFODZ_03930 [Marinicella sediminis]|uniref:Right handed beta helix domain-containing protein n=1 Tax=Marinicella sediminis TaxID=1792834 RepID=A0ABV7J611_9GAMM|nr:hypothetical protein [Marinicella sediminis]